MEFRFVGNSDCANLGDVAVVIDVLRAFSFAAYALDAVTFVITGGNGTAPEDLACAEYLAASLTAAAVSDPAPYLERVEAAGQDLLRGVELGYGGIDVDDLALCMDLDRFDFALRVDDDGQLVLRAG